MKAKLFITSAFIAVQALGLTSHASAKSNYTVSPEQMLDRFLRYVSVNSQSIESKTPGAWNMTEGQKEMARLIEADARALGADVYCSDDAYVYVTIPANIKNQVPVFGISCHLDFTPEAPGNTIRPKVIRGYKGGDIIQSPTSKIALDTPEGAELPKLIGKTIIHTDGTSLLGGDDKNGVTIAMSIIETLLKDKKRKHGKIQLVFCPNEDIGLSAERIDTTRFNPDILFDLDGEGANEITNENFTAKSLIVRFIGHDAHPGDAKKMKLGDALAASSTFIAGIPVKYRPENTEGKQGYIHPYKVDHEKDSTDYTVNTRIRYFDKAEGQEFDRIIHANLDSVAADFPNVKIEILSENLQYENVAYNMHTASKGVIDRAVATTGLDVNFVSSRGGTTASMFTAKGLRGGMCVFTGQHAIHGIHEFSVLEEMHDAYRLMLNAIEETSRLR